MTTENKFFTNEDITNQLTNETMQNFLDIFEGIRKSKNINNENLHEALKIFERRKQQAK